MAEVQKTNEPTKSNAEAQNEKNAQALHTALVKDMRRYIVRHAPIAKQLAVITFASAKHISEAQASRIYDEATSS